MITESARNHEILELMRELVTYRSGEVRHRLAKVVETASMLHVDALIMIYHFAKIAAGDILEIGAFIGGSTIAAALGVRASGVEKKMISIEPGGKLKNHRLASKDIFKDLKKNLARFEVADRVTLLNGYSFDAALVAHVKQTYAPGQVGLFLFDADNDVGRDLDCYGELLADNCLVVIDDYVIGAEDKVGPTREHVDRFVAEGKLVPLGYQGWGTWFGRWQRPPASPASPPPP